MFCGGNKVCNSHFIDGKNKVHGGSVPKDMKQEAKRKPLGFWSPRDEDFIIFHSIDRIISDKRSWEGVFPKKLERFAFLKSFQWRLFVCLVSWFCFCFLASRTALRLVRRKQGTTHLSKGALYLVGSVSLCFPCNAKQKSFVFSCELTLDPQPGNSIPLDPLHYTQPLLEFANHNSTSGDLERFRNVLSSAGITFPGSLRHSGHGTREREMSSAEQGWGTPHPIPTLSSSVAPSVC